MTHIANIFLGDDNSFVLKAFRCLCLLLTTVKTKRPDGDIPYVMKIVPVSRYVFITTLYCIVQKFDSG